MTINNAKITNLFWTGGWDSTFRLLQLLLKKKNPVQPIYVIDSNRKSLALEIKTMKKIKEKVFQNYPFCKELIQTTIYLDAHDLPVDQTLQEAYSGTIKTQHIGVQYLWLANLCKQNNIYPVELSIQQHQNPKRSNFCIASRVSSNMLSRDEKKLYQYFAFPLIDYTKEGMQEEVLNNQWQNIMNMTWFCHLPTKRNNPCGTCAPCTIAIDEGFGWRIPPMNRLRGFSYKRIQKIYRKIKN